MGREMWMIGDRMVVEYFNRDLGGPVKIIPYGNTIKLPIDSRTYRSLDVLLDDTVSRIST